MRDCGCQTHVQFLVVALCIFPALCLGLNLVLEIMQHILHLLVGALRRDALFPLLVQLGLELPHLLGEVTTQFLHLFLLGGQLSVVVGLGSLKIDLVGEERKT